MDLGWLALLVGLVLLAALLALTRARGRLLDEAHGGEPVGPSGGAGAPASSRRHDRRWERPAPAVEGVDLDGAPVALDISGLARVGEGLAVLVLLTTTCRSCADLWAGLAEGADRAAGAPLVAVVTPGTDVQPLAAVRKRAAGSVPVVLSSSAWEAYDAPGAPWFVVIDGASGLIRYEGTRRGWAEAGELVTAARDA